VPAPTVDIPSGAAIDASFYFLDTTNPSDVVVRAKDGTTLHFASYSGGTPSRIEDTNGNEISISYSYNGLTEQITDNTGKQVTVSYGTPYGTPDTISYKDSTGTSRTITLAYTLQKLTPTFTLPAASNPGSFTLGLLTSIALPNNLSWAFQYNTYGEMTKITYPTGGYTRYAFTPYTNWVATAVLPNPAYAADFRELTARYVCRLSGGNCSPSTTPEDETTYTPTVDGTKTNNQYMDVVSPLGDRVRHQFSYETSSSATVYYSMREIFRYQYQGQNTLLRTIETDYNNLDSNGNTTDASLPIRETTTLNDISPTLITKTEWDYSGTADDVSEERDYDFGSGAVGALIRKKDYTWLATNSVNNQNYTSTSIYILNRKSTEKISDANGNLFAQTQYEYDNYASDSKHAPLQASGAVQHDSAFSTSSTIRGNLTDVQHWRNTDGTWLTTYNQYDDAGNLLKTIDPAGHTSSFGFGDSWNNSNCPPSGGNSAAYRTSATNALNQTATSKFNSCSGTIASTTDPNSQTLTYTYDLMGRLTQTNFPDGGQTNRAFNESSMPLNVSGTNKITSATSGTGTLIVDGLGRTLQPQLNSDPQGVTYTDVTYDPLERKSTVSNPYRTTSEVTYGLTTYQYDALGRVTKTIPPDGSSTSNNVSTVYSGNCVTVTDEAGKTRKSCNDGLGRLTQVFEPNTSGSFVNETDYQYDVLDDLLSVQQKGNTTVSTQWRARTFTYNSLSQVLTAANPESGTITYAYDNEGKLLTKTDARSIVTTYTYDALHRVTGKTFSNGDATISYFYDQASYNGLTVTNGIGRETGMSDAAGAEAWSYDQLGRVLVDRRTNNSVTKNTTYTYNLDGSLATVVYPSGRTMTYTVNGAGRAVSAVDVANSINYATAASYSAAGALLSLKNGASLTSTLYYNNRLEACRISVTTASNIPSQCSDTVNLGNVLDFSYNYSAGTANNGDVMQIASNLNSARTQNFTYDQLNRISTAQTQATSGTYAWGYQYGYDIWGNLLSETLTQGSGAQLSLGVSTNNQITNTGFSYDAAGNVLTDSSFTYTWDGESRLKSVAGVTYTYDGEGRRVQKSNGKLYWYGAGSDPLCESDASGNITYEYVFFGGKRMARRDSSGNVIYYFADHLGSSRVVTSATGAVLDDSDFTPFGSERAYSSSSGNTYKFTGKERDTESTLDDFGARYYSSQFGRFESADWSASPSAVPYADLGNPQTLNLYAYVKNNPLNLTDPAGHEGIGGFHSGRGNDDTGTFELGGGGLDEGTGAESWDNFTYDFSTGNREQNSDTSNQPTSEASGDSADPAGSQPQNQQTTAETPRRDDLIAVRSSTKVESAQPFYALTADVQYTIVDAKTLKTQANPEGVQLQEKLAPGADPSVAKNLIHGNNPVETSRTLTDAVYITPGLMKQTYALKQQILVGGKAVQIFDRNSNGALTGGRWVNVQSVIQGKFFYQGTEWKPGNTY
jgi:RHS repeat-associated protein